MSRFADECGCPDGLTLVVESDGGRDRRVFAVAEPFAVFGSDETCTVEVEPPAGQRIAPERVYIQIVDDQVYVAPVDGGQTRGEPVRSAWVGLGERFEAGAFALRAFASDRFDATQIRGDAGDPQTHAGGNPFESGEEASSLSVEFADLADAADEHDEGPRLGAIAMCLRRSRRSSRSLMIRRDLTLIGQREGCKLRVASATVGPVHASLLRLRNSAWLVDLGSGCGTYVNGLRIRQSRLTDGQTVRIGGVDFDIRLIDESQLDAIVLDEPAAQPLRSDADPAASALPGDLVAASGVAPGSGTAPGSGLRLADPADLGGISSADQSVVHEMMLELGNQQRMAMEQIFELFMTISQTQQQTQQSQIEMIRQQNDQLVDLLKSAMANQTAMVSQFAQQPNGVQPSGALPNPPSLPGAEPTAAPAAPEPPAGPREDVPPPEAGFEVKSAWMRSQLHEISEKLRADQKQSVGQMLKRLFVRDEDALR